MANDSPPASAESTNDKSSTTANQPDDDNSPSPVDGSNSADDNSPNQTSPHESAKNSENNTTNDDNTPSAENTPPNQDESASNDDDEQAYRHQSPQKKVAEKTFNDIKKLIQDSDIESSFKEVALYDLAEAERAYHSSAFKAVIVMCGAVLEGMMLAVIRRPDSLQEFRRNSNTYKKLLQIDPTRSPDDDELRLAIMAKASFERSRQVIEKLKPEVENQKVESIQSFRNAIHPWKCISEPYLYRLDQQKDQERFTRAINHLSSLNLLITKLLA